MSERRTRQVVSGWCAVAGSLAAGVGNVLHPVTPRDDPHGVAAVIADSPTWTLIHVVILSGILLMTFGVIGFAHHLRDAGGGTAARAVTPAVLIGGVIGSLTLILDGVAAKQLADTWAGDPDEIGLAVVSANETVNFALAGLFNLTFAGIPYLLLGAAFIQLPYAARWLGWIAIGAGLFSVVAGGYQMFVGRPTELSLVLTIIGPTVVTLWTMMMGMLLVSDRFPRVEPDRIPRSDTPREAAMIEFQLSVDALGNTRFGYSPLGEVAASLRLLGAPSHDFVIRPWVQDVAAQLGRVDLSLLYAVAPAGPWAADFMFGWSFDPRTTIEQQLDDLARMPGEQLRGDLDGVWKDRPMPDVLRAVLDQPDPGRRVADAVWAYWEVAIAPYWPRIRAIVDDDVAYRGSLAITGGIFSLFQDFHPEVSLHDHVLRIDKPHHADRSYTGSQITLLPSVFVWPNLIIGHVGVNHFSLTYAARGVARAWEGLPSTDATAGDLGALVGRTRAAILQRLEIPMTTTQLARQMRQSPGTVSQHLSVLRRNGLLESWRSGRSVLYRRTALAASIVAAADHSGRRRRGSTSDTTA